MGSLTHRPVTRRAALVAAAVGLTAALGGFGAATALASDHDGSAGSWAAAPKATVSTSSTSAYTCFVTYPGGSTNVSYSLSYTSEGPGTVAPYHPYVVQVDFPVITPNPTINEQVADVTFNIALPPGAVFLDYNLTGGSGVTPTVQVANGVVSVEADGPFPAATPFQFPSISLLLFSGAAGTETVNQFGTTLSAPAFSWVRTDLTGTARPFACFLPAAVPLTATTVG